MARKTKTTTTTTTTRRSVEPAAADEQEKAGMGLDDGVVLTTTIALLGAIALVYFALQGMPAPVPA